MEALAETAPARRQRRLWTEEEQRQAEAMRADGASWRAIGRALGRHGEVVQLHLDAVVAENQREATRLWRKANPEKVRKSNRLWYAANSERKLENCRVWRVNNAKRKRERTRLWRKANSDKVRATNRRRYTITSAARRKALTPISRLQLRERFSLFGNCCAYCGSANDLTVDHVLTFAAGGLDEQSNVVPACRACNSSKYVHAVEEWYRRQPFFSEARWRKIQRHCPAAVAGQLPLAFCVM
jgi:5-methylcytosine-specific restriction endonuclease McrA